MTRSLSGYWVAAPRLSRAMMLALIAATTAAAAQGSKRPTADAAEFVRQYLGAHNQRNTAALMGMVSRAAGVSSVSMGKMVRGWESIQASVKQGFDAPGAVDLVADAIDVRALGPSHALAVASLSASVKTEMNEFPLRGVLTLVLETSGARWAVVHEHLSLELPDVFEGG